jgi:hypothetical protein
VSYGRILNTFKTIFQKSGAIMPHVHLGREITHGSWHTGCKSHGCSLLQVAVTDMHFDSRRITSMACCTREHEGYLQQTTHMTRRSSSWSQKTRERACASELSLSCCQLCSDKSKCKPENRYSHISKLENCNIVIYHHSA